MHRTTLRRFFAAFAAAWIVVSLAEPPGLHVCPTHSAGIGDRVSGTGHQHHDAANAAPSADPESAREESKGCLCLGDCASMFQSASAPTPSIVAVIVTQPHSALPALPEHAPVTRGGLVIPFANGPPVRA